MVFDLENLGCNGAGSQFWLAAHCVDAECEGTYWGLFVIYDGHGLNDRSLYDSDGSECELYRYVRPVVTLKSDVKYGQITKITPPVEEEWKAPNDGPR